MSFLLSLLGVGKIIKGFLASLPWQVYAAIGAVILALLLWHAHTKAEGRAHDAAYNAGFNVAWSEQHRRLLISEGNEATLEAALAAKNAESAARAKAFADSKTQDAQDVAAADQRAKGAQSRIAALQGLAQLASGNPTCKVPGALTTALEGL